MPELPEVYTVVEELKSEIVGETIKEVKTEGAFSTIEFSSIRGKKICSIDRKGKVIFFILEDKILTSHLKMTGKYLLKPLKENLDKIIFVFFSGKQLFYYDIRKFSLKDFKIQSINEYKFLSPYKNIGDDLLENEINVEKVFTKFLGKKKKIKEALLDQDIISGIGNIYASEILYESKISPLKNSNELTIEKYHLIIKNSKNIILEAIKLGGTSIIDFISPRENKGNYQNKLKVYGKKGKKCERCNEIILLIYINKRSTFFCSNCQI